MEMEIIAKIYNFYMTVTTTKQLLQKLYFEFLQALNFSCT